LKIQLFIPLQGEILVAMNNSSFKVYMCVEGSFSLIVDEVSTHYKKGDTILIPACLPDFHLKGIASILEIYIS